jgi:hypothetical protein
MTIPDNADRLESLLVRWADLHRLTGEQASTVHAAVLAHLRTDGLLTPGSDNLTVGSSEPSNALDVDWFLGLLRPVTALLDGPNRLNDMLSGLISVGA